MNLGLFILRLVVGLLFMGHGAQKLFGWFGGHGIEGTAGMFDSIGLRPGRTNAYLAGTCELGAGALIAAGLLTPFAAMVLTALMTVAIVTVHHRNGLWATEGGYEFNLVLIAAVFALAGVGAGNWSLDHAFALHDGGAKWAIGALVLGVIGGFGAVSAGRQAQPTRRARGHGHAYS